MAEQQYNHDNEESEVKDLQEQQHDDSESVAESEHREVLEPMKDGERWKEYSQNVSKNVALEKLRDATKKRQEKRLAEALQDCYQADVDDSNEEVEKAKYVLTVIQLQQELMALCAEEDADHIEEEFDTIKRIYAKYLDEAQWEMSQVRQRLWWFRVGNKFRAAYDQKVVSLSPSVISEIRRYSQPTKIVHDIVQATLLLFGVDENQSKSWFYCQKHLNPQGPNSMVSLLVDFDVRSVHSEIAARADELLKLLVTDLQANGGSEDNIRACSPSAFTLYVWTQGVLDQRRKIAKDEDETWKPARLKPLPSRQLKIFEEQYKAQQLALREAARQQQKDAAASNNSPRSKSPKRNTLGGTSKPRTTIKPRP